MAAGWPQDHSYFGRCRAIGRDGERTTAASIWCLPLPDWAHRTGTLTRAAPSLELRVASPTVILPVPRSNPSLSRWPTWSLQWKRIPASSLGELRVDGGASRNNLLLQFQADLLGVPVVRPSVTETTALGAAYLAGLAAGIYSDRQAIARQWQVDRRFEPAMSRDQAIACAPAGRAQWNAPAIGRQA